MMTDDLGQQLHNKATRGVTLSVDEQAQLEAWYATQDQAEGQQLNMVNLRELTTLHDQVEGVVHQLQFVTQRIQELTMQNELVRQEISHFQR